MELRVLKYFLVVAQEENMTRASQLLYISQPTLSRQLMQLEEELGEKLFIRHSRHVQLTGAGMLLKKHAQDMIRIEEMITRDFSKEADQVTGSIAIGCCEAEGMHELAGILHEFKCQYPLIHFELMTMSSDSIQHGIENGTLDFGLLLEPIDLTKYAFSRLHTKEHWGILVKEDDPLAQLDTIVPTDLEGYALIVPDRQRIQNELAKWINWEERQVDIVASYNIGYNMIHLVQEGMGIAVCLEAMGRMQGTRFIPFQGIPATTSVIAYKRNQPHGKAVSRFLTFIERRQDHE